MNRHRTLKASPPVAGQRGAFTLVEMLVALAVMMLLLSVIMIPIRLAFDSLNAGRSKAEVQQAAAATVSDIEQDIGRAVQILPNTYTVGITDKAPYSGNQIAAVTPAVGWPYTLSSDTADDITLNTTHTPTRGVCERYIASNAAIPWGNVSRLDMLVPRRANGNLAVDSSNAIVAPDGSDNYLVTYYPRVVDVTKAYDAVDNPVVLFRAQIVYKTVASGTLLVGGSPNADLSSLRFPIGAACGTAHGDPSSLWMAHDSYGEANLEPICQNEATDYAGAHSQVTPRGMSLNVPNWGVVTTPTPTAQLQPDTSFICEDTNGDGKIDRVTVNLTLNNYSATSSTGRNGKPGYQSGHVSRTIDVINAK